MIAVRQTHTHTHTHRQTDRHAHHNTLRLRCPIGGGVTLFANHRGAAENSMQFSRQLQPLVQRMARVVSGLDFMTRSHHSTVTLLALIFQVSADTNFRHFVTDPITVRV